MWFECFRANVNIRRKTVFLFSLLLLIQSLSGVVAENQIDYADEGSALIRGLIKPTTTTLISSEIASRIESLPYKGGDRFNKGDALVKFDCSLLRARYAVAQAEYEAGEKDLENKQRLLKLNAVSNIEVDLAVIEVKRLRASLRVAGVMIKRCQIKAPYSGRVIDTMVNQFESVGQDQELLSILNDKDLEIEVIVPSKWLNWLRQDIVFQFAVDETDSTYQATVVKIGAVVDPVSQTVVVKGKFQGDADVLAGMSGTARFQQP